MFEHRRERLAIDFDPDPVSLHDHVPVEGGELGYQLVQYVLGFAHFPPSSVFKSLANPSMIACGLAGHPGM